MKIRTGTLLAIIILLVLGFSSCRREYICQCTITYSGMPGLPDTIVKDIPITNTKKKAASECEANSSQSEKDGIKSLETCKLY